MHPISRSFVRSLLAACAAASALLLQDASAQGSFVNFESPQVKPLALFAAAGRDYLAVCNTPDSTVEIYKVPGLAFVTSFKTGLDPVSVRWHAPSSRLYVTNFLGDSVSMARVIARPEELPVVRLERSAWVGDEPSGIEFFRSRGQDVAFVTLNSRSAFVTIDADSLVLQGGPGAQNIYLTFPLGDLTASKALKEARHIRRFGSKIFILGTKGGNDPSEFDYDLFSFDLDTGQQADLGGLGTTNHAMEMARDGRLFVVGTHARNQLLGEAAVAAAPTGFVESRLSIVQDPGTAIASVTRRNLNRDPMGQVVPKAQAISQPTDLALLDGPGGLQKIFIAGFHSDRIGVVHPDQRTPDQWPMTYIDLPVQLATYSRTGPRSLVFRAARPDYLDDPGARIYVLNRLSNSLSEIDPINEVEVQRKALQHDPTPSSIRKGREFLYSADRSGNGFVSCASCHVDGRTDSLTWNLGKPGQIGTEPIPPVLIDGVTGQSLGSTFPADKGPMVTQSLQGLLNFPINAAVDYLFTNAPYHWRGDRPTFQSFNVAFVDLMGLPNLAPQGEPKRGITVQEMNDYTAFINTIMYPPNPEQPIDRRYSGDIGTPDLEDGSGARRGLKLFHTRPFAGGVIGGRSCVQCHALPEGSNNRITLTDNLGGTGPQPIETAAMRMLFQKEGRIEVGPLSLNLTVNNQDALDRVGGSPSINQFIFNVFNPAFSGEPQKLVDLVAFAREMDSGVAPAILGAITADVATKTSAGVNNAFAFAEQQAAEANIGVAVYSRVGTVEKGYWYDVAASPPGYREESTGNVIPRAQMLGALVGPDDVIVMHGVPVGSEQRIAALDGQATSLTGPAPSRITLEPMRPSTAWRDVPLLTKNWVAGTGANEFNWDGETSPGVLAPEPISLKAMRIFQDALINKAPQFGLTVKRHDPSHRFRLAGNDIRQGAVVVLEIPVEKPPGGQTQLMIMPIFPTDELTVDQRRTWETAIEADNFVAYMLLVGGPLAPDVIPTIAGRTAEPPPAAAFDPVGWNLYRVSVFNTDGTNAVGSPEYQALTIR